MKIVIFQNDLDIFMQAVFIENARALIWSIICSTNIFICNRNLFEDQNFRLAIYLDDWLKRGPKDTKGTVKLINRK